MIGKIKYKILYFFCRGDSLNMKKVIIFHNIISPYKILLFNELSEVSGGKIHVVFFAETAGNRDWEIDYSQIKFSYTLLNKGILENISNIKLVKQVAIYLSKNRDYISGILVGEYIKPAYWYALIWGWMHKKKNGCILESQQQDHRRIWIKEAVKKKFFLLCDYCLAAGSKHKEYAISLGMNPENISIINGVGGVNHKLYDKSIECLKNHINMRDYLANECNLPADKQYFIYVGRFSPEKNLFTLLEAYAALNERCPQWALLLVGGGKQLEELKSFIKKRNIQNVYFPGFIQQDRLPYYYMEGSVFVLPSFSETWGLVVDEAIYLGKPVIVSRNCGCVPDIVKNGINGWIVDPSSSHELYTAMKEAAENPKLLAEYGKNSKKISNAYSPANSAKKIWDMMK